MQLPGRYINGCISQQAHIVQSTCPKDCLWFVVVSILSVLHSFSPQFGYISLIVSLPYSFIQYVRLLPFLLDWRHCSYFVDNLCKSTVFIHIATVMNSPLVPLGGLPYSPVFLSR